MKQEILHLDYEINLKDYKKIWFDTFKKSLPQLFFFWGVAIVLSLLGLIFTNEKLVFTLTTITFTAIPAYSALTSYQNYMNAAKQAFQQLSESQRRVHLAFPTDTDGFDCILGKDFSHISWESITGVSEDTEYFKFEIAGSGFVIPKIALQNDVQMDFFREVISTNVGEKAKLLN